MLTIKIGEQRSSMIYSDWHKHIFSFRKIDKFRCEFGDHEHSGKRHLLSNRLYNLIMCSNCRIRNKSFLDKRCFDEVGK